MDLHLTMRTPAGAGVGRQTTAGELVPAYFRVSGIAFSGQPDIGLPAVGLAMG